VTNRLSIPIAFALAGAMALFCLALTTGTAEAAERGVTAGLQVGASAVDVTPTQFPVIVNGMFEERMADRAVDPLFARAFVLDDGTERIAIVVVDSCMLPRELIDDAKERAAKLTGIAVDHTLVSATHTHSAPSAMGCLGSRADPQYPAFLVPQIVRAIQLADERKQPARIGWTKVRAPELTFCRRYIRRPDRLIVDPFGQPTARAHMNPGFLSPDVIGPSGPVDDELSVVAMQSRNGKPLGVLANFSMHYVGSPLLSADYFGRFAEYLGKQIDGSDGATSCIVSMSQGTSGDLISRNQSAPEIKFDYDEYAKRIADVAIRAYRDIKYQDTAPLAMRETKLKLQRRVPDAEKLARSKEIAAKIGDRLPMGWTEVYALEQIYLHEEPERELVLQAVRIGDLGIAAVPNEVYGITGLKIKLQSPLPATFNIELANGSEGYIAPPEQHTLGGYTTWAARTAALEIEAEPKIVEALLKLLEEVSGQPRRPSPKAGGAYAEAVLKSKPLAFWRLDEISGDIARDLSGNKRNARLNGGFARYLTGPEGKGFADEGHTNHVTHLAAGLLRADALTIGDTYTVEFWFWNGLPHDARPITGYLFALGGQNEGKALGDHLGLGGTSVAGGRLFFSDGNPHNPLSPGKMTIAVGRWNHVVLAREGDKFRAHLNGQADPDFAGQTNAPLSGNRSTMFFGGREDNEDSLEGKLSDVAFYDRALSADEVAEHYKAALVSPGSE
jgi:hypothetical protein